MAEIIGRRRRRRRQRWRIEFESRLHVVVVVEARVVELLDVVGVRDDASPSESFHLYFLSFGFIQERNGVKTSCEGFQFQLNFLKQEKRS
jgi:hypothetical protein